MGKGGNKSQSAPGSTEKLEVLIENRYYDVTNLKHPGGSVIKFYAGKDIDASQAFSNFHIRSRKAQAMLRALPNREAESNRPELLAGQNALLKDFDKLTKELEAEGFFKPAPLHVFYRVTEIVVMHAIGLYLLLSGYWLAGIVVLGIVSGRCGWLMHEGGHYSLTGNISFDRTLQIVLYGVGCGMSGAWWRNQHNKHHSMPQVLFQLVLLLTQH